MIACNNVQHLLIFENKYEHVIGGVPSGQYILGQHVVIEFEFVQHQKPLGEEKHSRIFHHICYFAELIICLFTSATM